MNGIEDDIRELWKAHNDHRSETQKERDFHQFVLGATAVVMLFLGALSTILLPHVKVG